MVPQPKRTGQPSISALLIAFGLLLFLAAPGHRAQAGDVREPAWAGRFYPAGADRLERMIQDFASRARRAGAKRQLPPPQRLKGLVMPHAGFPYSGPVAAKAVPILEQTDLSKVILLGPDHRVGFANASLSRASAYATPLGQVPLAADCRRLAEQSRLFRTVPRAEQQEHSLEVVLPFLQAGLGDFSLVPLILGSGPVEPFVSAIDPLIEASTLVVASTDLSHYLDYEAAKQRDQETLSLVLDLKTEALSSGSNRACGRLPLQILMELAKKRGWRPKLVDYANSGDTAGPRSRVVGYACIAFYEEADMSAAANHEQTLSREQGQALVQLARETLLTRLRPKEHPAISPELQPKLSDPALQRKQGTFVTLHKNGSLRGCIGSIIPESPLVEGVKENVQNAAFKDPRFPPLRQEELDEVDIEVSILTEPEPLDYEDGPDLLRKLQPFEHGVILKKGLQQSTFLPQVWEQLPQPEQFLSHLCAKAGLPQDAWRQGGLQVLVYRVQYFEEGK
jgi:hypothetical protein